jgi:hypothetical protein
LVFLSRNVISHCDYVLAETDNSPSEPCGPHHSAAPRVPDDSEDWRNTDAQKIIDENKLTGIHYVPFFNATKELYQLHPGKGDCTHFCWTPTLWQPLWAALYSAVTRDAYIKGASDLGADADVSDALLPPMTDNNTAADNLMYMNGTSDESFRYQWVPMREPHQWYSPAELCIYKHLSPGSSYASVAAACGVDAAKMKSDEATLMLGNVKHPDDECFLPLSASTYFLQTLAGFREHHNRALVEALNDIHINNRALVFFGDSMTQQSMMSMFAELKRLDSSITVNVWKTKVNT